MDEQKDIEQEWKERCRIAFGIALIIGIADISVLFLGNANKSFTSWSVGTVGIITFLGVLMLVNYLSKDPNVTKGEVRKAIAASCIAVYFVLVALLTFSGSNLSDTLVETVIEHFTYIIGIVIVFYFGSRSIEEYMKLKGKQVKIEAEEKEPKQKKDPQSDESNNEGNMQVIKSILGKIELKIEEINLSNHCYVFGSLFVAVGLAMIFVTILPLPKYYLALQLIAGFITFVLGVSIIVVGSRNVAKRQHK